MIKAVIFDCFGVLTADLWKEFCNDLPASLRTQARDLNHALDSGLITQADFIQQVHELTGREPEMVETSLGPDQAPKNLPLLQYIAELKQSYKISLLSNISSDWITKEFLTPAEQALFDDMVFSFQVGVTKPDPQIFQIACQNLGVEPSQAVFIDDVESNCQGAQAVGMQAIVYESFGQAKQTLEQLLNE